MKKAISAIAILSLLILTGCKSAQATLQERRDSVSWSAFCAARGYDTADSTGETVNEYLDTWCGTSEEEDALTNANVEL